MPMFPETVSRIAQTSESRKLHARSLSPFNCTMARSSGVFASIRRIVEGRLKKGVVEANTPGKNEKNIAAFGQRVFGRVDVSARSGAATRSVKAKLNIHRHAENASTSGHSTLELGPVGALSAAPTAAANTPSSASRGLRPSHPWGHR